MNTRQIPPASDHPWRGPWCRAHQSTITLDPGTPSQRGKAATHTAAAAADLIAHSYGFDAPGYDGEWRETMQVPAHSRLIAAYGPISPAMERAEKAEFAGLPVIIPSAWERALARAIDQNISAVRMGCVDRWIVTSSVDGEYKYEVRQWSRASNQALSCTCAAGSKKPVPDICKHLARVWQDLEDEMAAALQESYLADLADVTPWDNVGY